jgi:hypothetical protein
LCLLSQPVYGGSALNNGDVSEEARCNPEFWQPSSAYNMTEHECMSLRRQVWLPDIYSACAVAGSVFKGWSAKFKYDSSAAWIKWEDAAGQRHVQLARVLYFISVSACMFLDCPRQEIALVRWFQGGNGTVRLTSRSQSEFVFVKQFEPVRVLMMTDKSALTRKGSLQDGREFGPWRVHTLERTRWH